jgi:hypothetical protein
VHHQAAPAAPAPAREERREGSSPPPKPEPTADGPEVALEQVADAWQRTIVEAVRERSIPVASLLAEARPTDLAGDTLTLEFPAGADFHRRQVAEPQNIVIVRDAIYEVTGRKLAVVLEAGEAEGHDSSADEPAGEESFIEAMKENFDAREVTEPE